MSIEICSRIFTRICSYYSATWPRTIAHCGSSVQGCQLPLPTPNIIWFSTESNRVFTGLKWVYWSVPVNKLFFGANSEINALKVIYCWENKVCWLIFQSANTKMHLTTYLSNGQSLQAGYRAASVVMNIPFHKGYLHFHPHTVTHSLHFMAQQTSKHWDP